MSKEKKYYQHSGWIVGGPSREAMFDSLRLGKVVDVQFITTDKEIVDRRALITSISRQDITTSGENDKWNIELFFAEKYFSKNLEKKMKFFWKGIYSTQSREGELLGNLPRCLIV